MWIRIAFPTPHSSPRREKTWIRNIPLSLRRPKTSPKLIQEETRRRKNGIAGRVLRIRNLRGSNSATLLKCTRKTEYIFLDRDLILLYHWTNLVRFSPYFASADIVRRFGSFKIPLLNVNVDTNRLYYRHLLTLMWINVDLRTVSISEHKRVAPRDRCHRRMPQSAPAARLRPVLHLNHVEGDVLMRATGLPRADARSRLVHLTRLSRCCASPGTLFLRQ